MKKTQETELKNKLENLDLEQSNAVIMIIAEHARVEENQKFDTQPIKIPYNGIQNGKDVVFDIKNFPNNLKWILWKFVNLGSKK